jgi:hypothetical protein
MNNILIKSADRISGVTHDFIYKTQQLLDGEYVLQNVIVPNTCYNINSRNNTFILFEDSTNKDITLDQGNYTVASLISEIQNKLDAASVGYQTFSVSFDTANGLIKITGTLPFQLIFPDSTTALTYGFDNLTTVMGTIVTADNIVDLSYPLSIGIDIDESDKDNYLNPKTNSSSSLYVPFNVSFGVYKNLSRDEFRQTIKFNNVRTLHIRIVNTSDNTAIDLHGSNYEMLLCKC